MVCPPPQYDCRGYKHQGFTGIGNWLGWHPYMAWVFAGVVGLLLAIVVVMGVVAQHNQSTYDSDLQEGLPSWCQDNPMTDEVETPCW